jgi:spermidine synthase
MVLPLLGGSPSVWNTCLVFYQGSLLAGYVYAHVSVQRLGPRRQAVLHLALLCLPWLVLPIGVARGWIPPGGSNPTFGLWMLLTVSLGLPFVVVSSTAPLVQAWFAQTGSRAAKDPYFLYAASNLGSMLGLLAYPLVIESHLTLAQQSWWWAVGYGLLMAMIAGCAVCLWRSRALEKGTVPFSSDENRDSPQLENRDSPQRENRDSPRVGAVQKRSAAKKADATPAPQSPSPLADGAPTLVRRLRWLALAMVPSSLLLGVTAHISTDIASMPLLWVVPLALYLLSFVLVFARRQILPHRWMVWAQALLIVVLATVFYLGGLQSSEIITLAALHLLAFFATAMVCHGEMAADRPASRYLTEFYLWMSVGGVVGGLLNALVAPAVFPGVWEYPLMIVAACLLRPRRIQSETRLTRTLDASLLAVMGIIAAVAAYAMQIKHLPGLTTKVELVGLAAVGAFCLQRRPVRFAAGVAVVLGVSMLCAQEQWPIYQTRSFFGVLRVEFEEQWSDNENPTWFCRKLMHGSTLHGMQSVNEEEALEPWTYYHRTGPVGDVFTELERRDGFRTSGHIGVVGLGTGTIAAYGLPGQKLTYFEIDPAVLQIATNPNYFTYLHNCKADWNVVLGDARLSLVDEPDQRFDVLLIDAFSSDAIPVHLLTKEAIQLYFDKLADYGLLAIHISNRHLNLAVVLGNLAADAGKTARICSDDTEWETGKCSSTWVVMTRTPEDLGELDPERWLPLEPDPKYRLWTDDFSNIVSVMDPFSWDWLDDWKWWRKADSDGEP